ncbi:MAG TPA: hypothetical protein VMS29_07475 [Pyrinomonadaceae bacterium]|nr:hypothetical protein [Pyrinomonadaceae bacterium]
MGIRILAGILLGLWLVFVLMGRGGFIHLLLLVGVSVAAIDLVAVYRSRNVRRSAENTSESKGPQAG